MVVIALSYSKSLWWNVFVALVNLISDNPRSVLRVVQLTSVLDTILYTGNIGITKNTVVETHSVSSQSWKTSGTTLTRHSLQSRRTLGTGSTRGSSISLKNRWEVKKRKRIR